MQSYISLKSAKIVDVQGVVFAELSTNKELKIGASIQDGTTLNFSNNSKVTLSFDDGSQQQLTHKTDGVNEVIEVKNLSLTEVESDLQSEISAIQDLITSGNDLDIPDTAAGEEGSEGTNTITIDRVGSETLAQAFFDTQGITNTINNEELLIDTPIVVGDTGLDDNNEVVSLTEDSVITGNLLSNAFSLDNALSVIGFSINGVTQLVGSTVNLPEGDLTINADGTYSFTPAENFNGVVPNVVYSITDSVGDTTSSNLAITVTPVSDLVDLNEVVTVTEDTTATGNVLTNATLSTGNSVTVTSFTVEGFTGTTTVGNPVLLSEGVLTLNVNGNYTFVPADNFNGLVPSISYVVTDTAGDTVTSNLAITVTPDAFDALDDSNFITFNNVGGFTDERGVIGNLITGGSSGDAADIAGDFDIRLQSVSFEDQEINFLTNDSPQTIVTDYGTLTVYGSDLSGVNGQTEGSYEFRLNSGIDVDDIPSSLIFSYTIQDGDEVNTTDTANLEIFLNNADDIPSFEDFLSSRGLDDVNAIVSDSIFDDFRESLLLAPESDVIINSDLTSILSGETDSLDDILPSVGDDNDESDESIVAQAGSSNSDNLVVNGLLSEGATLQGDSDQQGTASQNIEIEVSDII